MEIDEDVAVPYAALAAQQIYHILCEIMVPEGHRSQRCDETTKEMCIAMSDM